MTELYSAGAATTHTPTQTPAALRSAMRHWVTGVAIVTTVVDGVDHAMTVNSLTSVSLDPPLALVCVEHSTRFHDAVLASGRWAVSVLDGDSADVAAWLATRGRPLEGQLDRAPHRRGQGGIALLTGALAWLECVTESVYPGGDHVIVVGRVVSAEAAPDASDRPVLGWAGGKFVQLPAT